MLPVYSAYFGLKEAPFNITPDPGFLFVSGSHCEGLAQLKYGIETRRGFIVLTGEVGTGKTTLIQTLLGQLGDSTQTALIFSAIVSPIDLLRYVCEEFRLVEPKQGIRDVHDYLYLLNEFLLLKYREGQNAALIIDEAQNLTTDVLESVRLLSNFETTKDKLLQIVLVGQPELNDRLETAQLRQLKQRVALRHHLRPLSLSECQEYIANRLKIAGGEPNLFVSQGVEAVYQYSGGIPRLINVICDNAMISAYALEKSAIELQMIHEVAEDLCLVNSASKATLVRRATPSLTETRVINRSDVVKPASVQLVKNHRSLAVAVQSNVSLATSIVPESFLVSLRDALVDAMGPMAPIVLSEQVKRFGASMDGFPRDKIVNLIESVSKEIFDESIRDQFRKGMSDGIRTLPSA
ncbi:MAG TPA: AAA family ATPase [Acidobacteriota bacterium]|nr:AAA family ATPase [Acidobacteriota bacterium]